jgi:hypothetical protein
LVKTGAIGARIGALAGVVQLLCFELLCLLKLEARPTALGLALTALPSVGVAAACGFGVAVLFWRLRLRTLTGTIAAVGLYWVLAWLFTIAVVAWIRRSPGRINGAGLMAFPWLMAVLWILGAILMIPTAIIIKRAVRPAVSAA